MKEKEKLNEDGIMKKYKVVIKRIWFTTTYYSDDKSFLTKIGKKTKREFKKRYNDCVMFAVTKNN